MGWRAAGCIARLASVRTPRPDLQSVQLLRCFARAFGPPLASHPGLTHTRACPRAACAPSLPRSFHEYYDDIMKYYRLEHKDGQGHSTGWASLDAYYKVRRVRVQQALRDRQGLWLTDFSEALRTPRLWPCTLARSHAGGVRQASSTTACTGAYRPARPAPPPLLPSIHPHTRSLPRYVPHPLRRWCRAS